MAKKYWCSNCKRMTSAYHKCFMLGTRALKSKPNPNTRLARKMAKLYKEATGTAFPGGIKNARIKRLSQEGYADAGAWKWSLWTIDDSHGFPSGFGSQIPATDCAKATTVEYFHITNSDGYGNDWEIIDIIPNPFTERITHKETEA